FSNTFGRARRRVATAAASLLGPMFRILLVATALLVLIPHRVSAQEPAASPSPSPSVSAEQTLKVPPVANGFFANAARPLPALSRVGAAATQQPPLRQREAIARP